MIRINFFTIYYRRYLPCQLSDVLDFIVPNFLKLISGTPNKTTAMPTHHTTLNQPHPNDYTHLIDYQSQKNTQAGVWLN